MTFRALERARHELKKNHHVAVVKGWWSAIISSCCCGQGLVVSYLIIILLWSVVGGQLRTRSLEGPFRGAFGKNYVAKLIFRFSGPLDSFCFLILGTTRIFVADGFPSKLQRPFFARLLAEAGGFLQMKRV